jgi:hypothetical protein
VLPATVVEDKIEDVNSNSSSSNESIAKKTNEDDFATIEEKNQESTRSLEDLTLVGEIGDDKNQNDEDNHGHNCSCPHPSDQINEEDNFPRSNHYNFSEECDVLVKVMPDKFSKGFCVVQEKITNQTWIAGQTYKKKLELQIGYLSKAYNFWTRLWQRTEVSTNLILCLHHTSVLWIFLL